MSTFNLVDGLAADYKIVDDKALVHLGGDLVAHGAIYEGAGDLVCYYWNGWNALMQFVTSKKVEAQPSQGGEIEFPLELFPASCLLDTGAAGVIRAPAIKIESPHGKDVWLFLLRSKWSPGRPVLTKTLLSASHGADVATASLRVGMDDEVIADVTAPSSSFKRVDLTMSRSIATAREWGDKRQDTTVVEAVGSTERGQVGTSTWRPKTFDFEALFAFYSKLTFPLFRTFMETIGAVAGDGRIGGQLASDFISDGPGMKYSLKLSGVRTWMPNAVDVTDVTFPNGT